MIKNHISINYSFFLSAALRDFRNSRKNAPLGLRVSFKWDATIVPNDTCKYFLNWLFF